ncbi:MAG: YncE family protein [Thermodesulfovibrionales bacterium]|nr:YncE family protein [Thermodesulfovibrionales bacterium]
MTKKSRRNGHRNRSRLLLIALCSLLVFGVGCASVNRYSDASSLSGGQVSFFLKVPERISTDLTVELSAVNIMAEDGTFLEVMNAPLSIRSSEVAGRQVLLGEKALPEGRYKKLQLIVRQALVNRKDGAAHLALPPEGIETAIDIAVKRNQNTALFLKWNPDASVGDGYLFSPAFDVRGQTPELSSLLIYVTNEDSDNVSVINRQTGEVVAMIMVGRKPRGVAVSQSKERQRVYVANSGSNSISVIDPTNNRVEVEIPIRFGKEPEGIAVARVAPDKEFIFVTNYGSNTVSIIDASTYQEFDRANVGDGPIAIVADPSVDTISSSRFLSMSDMNTIRNYRRNYYNVYVANKNSRDVSILKMDRASGRPEEVITLNVQWSPIALTVDYPRGKVYVANYGYDNLSLIDIIQVIGGNKSGAVSETSNVGASLTGVISDPDFDRLYLLKEFSGEILMLRPFSEASSALKTSLSPVIGTISVGSQPRSFLMDPEGRKIYVVNRGSDSVSVVDKTTKREEKVIPVGRRPYGIAMFPEKPE